jgi:hypothetical protein
VLAAALVAALAGCGGGGSTHGTSTHALAFSKPVSRDVPPVSAAEATYLRSLGRFRSDVSQSVVRLTSTKTVAAARTQARSFDRCARKLRALGKPPSAHLRVAQRAFMSMCASLARIRTIPPSRFVDDAPTAVNEAGFHLRRAEDAALWRSEGRPLPAAGLVAGHSASMVKSHVDATFGRAATKIIGKRITVRCFDRHDWLAAIHEMSAYSNGKWNLHVKGFAPVDSRHVNLAPEECAALEKLAYGRDRPHGQAQLDVAVAVHVLAHESGHAAGIDDEAEAECYSVQRVALAAETLGVERPYARALQDVYWRVGYPQNLPTYKSRECRNGGRFDLRPRNPAFP